MSAAKAPTQAQLESVIAKAEGIDGYFQNGLSALKSNTTVVAIIKDVPALEPYAAKLLGLVPILGNVMTGLEVLDAIIENWPAIMAFCAAVHLKSASGDALAEIQAAKGQDL